MGYIFTNISRIWETFLEAIGGHLTLGLGGILFLAAYSIFWVKFFKLPVPFLPF